jgi:hypothetical protein
MKSSLAIGVALYGAVVVASVATAQQPTASSPGKNMGIEIALQAGGDSYHFTGQASCAHSPRGFIYGVPAKLWSVSHSDKAHSVSLTFWQPTRGSGDMFTMNVQAGGRTLEVTTVKTDQGGSLKGSGVVTFTPVSAGGTFTVNATASNGAKITGTIKCNGFRPVYAEGGN